MGSDWCANGDDFVAGSTEVSPGGMIDKDTDKDKEKDKTCSPAKTCNVLCLRPGGAG